MPDWTKAMEQTFEYYVVDPITWKDKTPLRTVKSSKIIRDSSADTLGSASFDINEAVGECYIRTYLVTTQNGVTEKHSLGTHLVQTPSSSFDGRVRNVSMDAYTPLIELKENPVPLGYYVPKTVYHEVSHEGDTYTVGTKTMSPVIGEEVAGVKTVTGEQVYKYVVGEETTYYCMIELPMDITYRLLREQMRGPVVKPASSTPLHDDFIADTDDTWFSFIHGLITKTNNEFDLDELSRVLIAPKQDTASLQPVWTYNDDNSSILYPELEMDHDLYMVPNVVEVIYFDGLRNMIAKAVNDDENSPTSTVNRGRRIIHRVTEPDIPGVPTEKQLEDYAERVLRDMSTVEHTVSYSHGYCPVRLGDCVRLNYSRAGLSDIKARVVYQSIECKTGCKVSEKAVYTVSFYTKKTTEVIPNGSVD